MNRIIYNSPGLIDLVIGGHGQKDSILLGKRGISEDLLDLSDVEFLESMRGHLRSVVLVACSTYKPNDLNIATLISAVTGADVYAATIDTWEPNITISFNNVTVRHSKDAYVMITPSDVLSKTVSGSYVALMALYSRDLSVFRGSLEGLDPDLLSRMVDYIKSHKLDDFYSELLLQYPNADFEGYVHLYQRLPVYDIHKLAFIFEGKYNLKDIANTLVYSDLIWLVSSYIDYLYITKRDEVLFDKTKLASYSYLEGRIVNPENPIPLADINLVPEYYLLDLGLRYDSPRFITAVLDVSKIDLSPILPIVMEYSLKKGYPDLIDYVESYSSNGPVILLDLESSDSDINP